MDPQYTLSDKSLQGTGAAVIKFGFRQERRELLQANDSMTGGSKVDPVLLALPPVLLVLRISGTDVGTDLLLALAQSSNLLFYKNFRPLRSQLQGFSTLSIVRNSKNKKMQTRSVSVLRGGEGRETPIMLCPLERKKTLCFLISRTVDNGHLLETR
jgi:hypothetical protein